MSDEKISGRRSFIAATAAAGLSVSALSQQAIARTQDEKGGPKVSGPQNRDSKGGNSKDQSEFEFYQSLTGRRFSVKDPASGYSTELKLEEVKAYPLTADDARPDHCRQLPFIMLFSGSTEEHLDETTYVFSAGKFATANFDLQPVGGFDFKGRNCYQVVLG